MFIVRRQLVGVLVIVTGSKEENLDHTYLVNSVPQGSSSITIAPHRSSELITGPCYEY